MPESEDSIVLTNVINFMVAVETLIFPEEPFDHFCIQDAVECLRTLLHYKDDVNYKEACIVGIMSFNMHTNRKCGIVGILKIYYEYFNDPNVQLNFMNNLLNRDKSVF